MCFIEAFVYIFLVNSAPSLQCNVMKKDQVLRRIFDNFINIKRKIPSCDALRVFFLPNHLHNILVILNIMSYSESYFSILISNCLFIHVKMSHILTIGYSYTHILLFKFLCDNTVGVEGPVKLKLNSAHFADFLTWIILAFLA